MRRLVAVGSGMLHALPVVALVLGWLLLAAPAVFAQGSAESVRLLRFSGAVTPVLDRLLRDSIEAAAASGAQALILELDTPGGSVDVTSAINQRILASPVPVIVYVAPSGARAGSAGTFITLAAHAAAMAPNTSIGAASPVDAGGADVGETMEAKVTNILSADIENLAKRRGPAAVEWAIGAVREANAATADQALELGVIDFVAADVADLLRQLDGFTVTVQGAPRTLATAGAFVLEQEIGWLETFLNFITNPTIATILVTVGTAGLLAEVWNPGTWVPGVIGIICLLLGLYALGQLDANFAALALMALGLGLFVAEAFTPTFGALLVAGMIAFGLGTALLFDEPGMGVSWPVIGALAGGLGLFVFFASAKGVAAQRRPALTGGEGLLGLSGRVKETFGPGEQGSALINGEWWTVEIAPDAYSAREGLRAGERVQVVARRGYTLLVKRAS